MGTKIEWASDTWNPITGCSPISEGCRNCYAKRMSQRLAGRFGYPGVDSFKITLHDDKRHQPTQWRKHKKIFVCSMGDLFHEDVPESWLDMVFDEMLEADWHTYMILTKRPERMRDYVKKHALYESGWIWYGVTAENGEMARKRIPMLLTIPKAIKFVSVEPMLGPISIEGMRHGDGPVEYGLDWVICGAETGSGARPMHLDWARFLRDECRESNTPFFFKKAAPGITTLDGEVIRETP